LQEGGCKTFKNQDHPIGVFFGKPPFFWGIFLYSHALRIKSVLNVHSFTQSINSKTKTYFMRLNSHFTTVVIACFFILASGCSKDDKKDNSKVTKSNIAGTYKLTAAKYKDGSNPEQDLYSLIPACSKDDVTTLKTDNTYVTVDQGTKCNPPNDDSGTWNLPNETTLVMDGDSYTIKSFNGSTLQLSLTDNSSGTTEVTTITLVKQ
jgi:Lipocalin-like domain